MANEKVQRWSRDGLRIDEHGPFVTYSDHVARVGELLGALRAWQNNFHRDYCYAGESDLPKEQRRKCDLCKKADALLKGES